MKALNKVKIENTFRISASSALEAATIAITRSHMNLESIDLVLGEDSVFVSKSTITTTVYNDVIFVELMSNGKYRVEVGSDSISEFEYTHLTGGDDAVNESGFYINTSDGDVISSDEYNSELNHWIASDIKECTPNRMESYIKRKFKKAVMVNGEFKEADSE